MGKRCKILIVAIMIAAIAVTGGIVSLGSANADNEILDTTRYVTVSGATVAAAQDLTAEGSGNIHKGLLISPETAGGTYSGKINGIFKTDMKITFSLPTEKQSNGAAGRVDLTVRFADVNDANNYFDVEYYNCGWSGWYTAAAVKDNEGHYRTTNYDNSKTIYDEKYTSESDTVIYYPFAGDMSGGDNGISGCLGLEWNESGILNVYAPSKKSGKYTIAKFDSDEYSASDGANSFYGLKKIAFENGFTVSYIAKSKNYNSKDITTPILIESVTTKGAEGADETFSFENATAAAEPSWFAEYAKIPQISLGDNVIKAKYKDSFTVPEASYSFPVRGGSDSAVCAKAEYSTDGGATYNYTAAGEILEAAGSYKLRYTAVEGSSLPGNTVEYSFVIMDEYFDNASAVSVTGATVTAGADKSGSVTHKGLLIEPAEEKGIYSGKINGIFAQGSTTIQFSSPGTSNQATQTAIYFKFVDANDLSNYFTVEYAQNGWYTGAAVGDNKGHYRTTNYYDVKKILEEKEENGGDATHNSLVYPWIGQKDSPIGKLFLDWDGSGVLTVSTTGQKPKYTLARFDSDTYASSDGEKQFYGLKKINFGNGFYVEFGIKASKTANNILLESIVNDGATYNFDEEVVDASQTPAWYTAYLNAPQITVDGTFESMYTTEEGVTVPTATFVTLADPDAKAVAKIEYAKDGGAFTAIPADRKLTEKGNYVVRYTAVEGSSIAGNAIERSFRIVDEYFDMAKVVSTVGATVTAGADKSGSVTHKGLLIEPAEEKGAYGGKINGTFNGNSSIRFNFVGTLLPGGNHNARAIDFAIRVADVSDENNYFDIVWFRDGWNGWYNAAAVVDKNGNIRVAREKDGKIFDKKTASDDGNALNSLPYYGGNDSPSGMLEFVWEDDVLAIYSRSTSNDRFALAKFDGTAAIDNDASPKTFGLGKIAFPNGYTISFNASAAGDENTVPLLLEEINGISLASKMLAPEKMVLDEENCALLGNEVVTVNGTNDVKTAAELGLGARFPYTVAFGSLTVGVEKTILATVPALNEYATTPFTYTYLGKTLNQSVTVVNAAPVVTLNVAATENFRMGGPNASTLTLGVGDVTATDLVDGKEGVTVKIYVKAPSADDSTEVTDGSAFAPTETGEYIVKYVGIDKDGNASNGTTRSIIVIDGKVPVIVVDEIADSALIKSSITVPTATATDGGDETTPLDVTFKVIYKANASDVTGEELSVAQGEKMTFDRAGTYVFVYYSIDADGNEIDKTFAVTVRPDTDRPVLTVEGGTDNVTATKGEEITVRPATAADEVDGTVTVTVKVTFGVTEVTVTDGKFVAENEGVYSVTYTASDEAGNPAEVTYSITVSPVAAPEKKGCGKQTARDLAIMLGSLSAILAAALFVGKKG